MQPELRVRGEHGNQLAGSWLRAGSPAGSFHRTVCPLWGHRQSSRHRGWQRQQEPEGEASLSSWAAGLSPPGTWNTLGMGDPLSGARDRRVFCSEGGGGMIMMGLEHLPCTSPPETQEGGGRGVYQPGAFLRVKGMLVGTPGPRLSQACPPVGRHPSGLRLGDRGHPAMASAPGTGLRQGLDTRGIEETEASCGWCGLSLPPGFVTMTSRVSCLARETCPHRGHSWV